MRPLGSIVASIAIAVVCEFTSPTTTPPHDEAAVIVSADFATLQSPSELPDASPPVIDVTPPENLRIDGPQVVEPISASGQAIEPSPSQDLKYLKYYVYSEIPPDPRPADIASDFFKDIPVGTPLEEIKRVSDAFGLDFTFMKTVAKIESDFDPKQRTGSYIGLFQLSKYEFAKYGSGEITSARDNAIAAAYKFINEATQFEWDTHKNPTASDLYLFISKDGRGQQNT